LRDGANDHRHAALGTDRGHRRGVVDGQGRRGCRTSWRNRYRGCLNFGGDVLRNLSGDVARIVFALRRDMQQLIRVICEREEIKRGAALFLSETPT
jgi:hypothetical protein